MNSDDGDREELIFDAALQAESESERRDILERMCGHDLELRARVEKLLAAYAASQALETSIALTPDFEARFGSLEGKQVGAYEVLQPIGEGGMGEVYRGRSVYTREFVAIKTIKPGMDTRQVVSRFEQERRALQRLEHPNIAEFIESGVTENGRAYFVMELVRGLPITDYCLRHQLDLAQVLRLFIEVCKAVQYANSCGMVHRDLKPNNLLVQDVDGQPVVKIIDFGISKALSAELKVDTLFTGAVQWLGTPAYMSPEQCQWSGHVDQRSDVYALGVVLFELLTGCTPLSLAMPSTKSFENAQTIIAGGLPPRPSDVLRGARRKSDAAGSLTSSTFSVQQVRGDLDWIVLKALEKQPAKRYQNVNELAIDLVAFLNDEPITATRPAHMQSIRRVARFMRHNRVLWVVVAIAVVVGSIFGSQLSNASLQLFGTVPEETSISRNRDTGVPEPEVLTQPSEIKENVERHAFIGSIRQVDGLRNAGRIDDALVELEALKQTHSRWQDHFLVRYLQHTIRKPDIFETGAVGEIGEIHLSPNGDCLAMGDAVGNIKLWDWPSRKLRRSWKAGSGEIQRIRISANNLKLATAGQEKEVIVWDLAHGQLLSKGLGHERTITGLSWSSDNQRLATGDRDGVVVVWNVADMSPIKKLKVDGAARAVEFSYDGKYLAASNEKTGTHLWSTSDWSEKAFIPNEAQVGDQAIAFSPNGRTMAVAGYGPVRVYDIVTGHTLVSPSSPIVGALRFGPHGVLYVGRNDGHVDVVVADRDWRRLASVKVSHEADRVRSIDFFNNNRTLAVGMGATGLFGWINVESILGFDFRLYEGIPLGHNDELNAFFASNSDSAPSVLEGRRDGKLTYSIPSNAAIDHIPPLYFSLRNSLAISTRYRSQSHVRLVGLSDNQMLSIRLIPSSTTFLKPVDERHALLTMSRHPPLVWNIEGDQFIRLNLESLTGNCVADYSTATGEIVVAERNTRMLHRFSINGDHLGTVEHNRRIFSLDYAPIADAFMVGENGSLSIWSSDLSLQQTVLLDESDRQLPVVIARYLPSEELLAVVTEDGTCRLIDMRTRLVAIELPTYLPTGTRMYFVGLENPNRLTFGYGAAKQVLTLSAVGSHAER